MSLGGNFADAADSFGGRTDPYDDAKSVKPLPSAVIEAEVAQVGTFGGLDDEYNVVHPDGREATKGFVTLVDPTVLSGTLWMNSIPDYDEHESAFAFLDASDDDADLPDGFTVSDYMVCNPNESVIGEFAEKVDGDFEGVGIEYYGGNKFRSEQIDDFDEEYVRIVDSGNLMFRLLRVLSKGGAIEAAETPSGGFNGGLYEDPSDEEYRRIATDPQLRSDIDGERVQIAVFSGEAQNGNFPPKRVKVFRPGTMFDDEGEPQPDNALDFSDEPLDDSQYHNVVWNSGAPAAQSRESEGIEDATEVPDGDGDGMGGNPFGGGDAGDDEGTDIDPDEIGFDDLTTGQQEAVEMARQGSVEPYDDEGNVDGQFREAVDVARQNGTIDNEIGGDEATTERVLARIVDAGGD
jgi:hypothetical protein